MSRLEIPKPEQYLRSLNYEYYKAEQDKDFNRSDEIYGITEMFIGALVNHEVYHAIRRMNSE